MQELKCGRFRIGMDRPRIMAIINVTPDSFSGDGLGHDLDAALRRAQAAVDAGADLLDLGGESTRPGSSPVSEQEELDRVIPLVERLAEWDIPLSIDTVKPGVMRAALAAGASLINDVNAFRSPGAVEAVKDGDAALCVMHMKGEPREMQRDPHYDDVVVEVRGFLDERILALESAGVDPARILVDPGFGFGKTLAHNLELFRAIDSFASGRYPVLVGVSRKSMLGAITGRPVEQRATASAAAALLAVERGARIVRVHDVGETRDALGIWEALRGSA